MSGFTSAQDAILFSTTTRQASSSEKILYSATGPLPSREQHELGQLFRRVEALAHSAAGLGIEIRDRGSWVSLLSNLSAFSASTELTLGALLAKFYSTAMVPSCLHLDPGVYDRVVNELSTKPKDEQLHALAEFREIFEKNSALNWKSIPFAEKSIRQRIRQQNKTLTDVAERLAAEPTAVLWRKKLTGTIDTPEGRIVTKLVEYNQEQDKVNSVLATVYTGTSREHF